MCDTGMATTSLVMGNKSGRKDITAPNPNRFFPFIESKTLKFLISALLGVAVRFISMGYSVRFSSIIKSISFPVLSL